MKSIDHVSLGLQAQPVVSGFVPLQPFLGLDPQVQLQLAVDPVDAFVVPAIALHVAQIQKTQPKAPACACCRQTFQPVRNLIVLIAQNLGLYR